MYVNLNKLEESVLNINHLVPLIAIKQNSAGKKVEWLKEYLEESSLSYFKQEGLVKEVKPKNKSEVGYKLLRTTEKANKLLINLSKGEGIDEETEILNDWGVKIYKSRSNGIVRNKQESMRRLQWFKEITEISGNKLATLLASFIQDSFTPDNPKNFTEEFREFKNSNPRAVLSNCWDNICWTAPNDRAVHYTLGDSPLWSYYEDNQGFIENIWKEKGLIEE